jgi:hypothetical protein
MNKDRTAARPQVNLSLLRSNSLKFQPQEKKEEVRVMTKKKKSSEKWEWQEDNIRQKANRGFFYAIK